MKARPRRTGGKSSSTAWMVLLALGMLGLGLALGLWIRKPDAQLAQTPLPRTERSVARPAVRSKYSSTPSTAARQEASTEDLPRLALVIDDLGGADPELVIRLCAQPVPLTVAVLPFLEHSKRSAEIAHEAKKEVILHLPMEPLGYPGPGKDPGSGAILFGLPEQEVRARVRQALVNIPHRKGVNNHMGSRITPDATRMRWILEEVKAKGGYFLDSRTEKNSVAMEVAASLGMRSTQRKVFLDDTRTPEAIDKEWNRALELAKGEGSVVVIGHIDPVTVGALERLIPRSRDRVSFVNAGSLAQVTPMRQDAPTPARPR